MKIEATNYIDRTVEHWSNVIIRLSFGNFVVRDYVFGLYVCLSVCYPGLELSGGGGEHPAPVHVYRRSFLSENRP